jgi:hypothetical protein
MERQAVRQDHNPTSESLAPGAAAAFLNGPVLGAVARGGEAYGRALLGWQNELLRFAEGRLRADTDLGRSLVGCRDWAEVARLQQSWLSATLQDYVDEVGRLFRLAAAVGDELSETAGEEVRQAAARGTDRAERARSAVGRAAAQSRPRRRQRRG